MRRLAALTAAARRVPALGVLALAAATAAQAGEARCWVDRGAVVVAASLGGVAGDFILDLAAPRSELHETTARANGVEAPALAAMLDLAGERTPASFAVADLDARGLGMPTNIAGVIGEDVLGRYVVDLRLAPCRLTLWPGAAPALVAGQTLPVRMTAGAPAVTATVTDGRRTLQGAFAIDTSAPGVRLSDGLARLSRTPQGADAGSRLAPPARLAGLEVGDRAIADAPAGLEAQTPAGLAGSLGTFVWSRYAWMRLDVAARRLQLGPAVR